MGRVRHIGWRATSSRPRCRGPKRCPYRVTVRIERREFSAGSSVRLATRCTCPVGNRCRHAAALVLAARRPGAPGGQAPCKILAWARGLREAHRQGWQGQEGGGLGGHLYLCSVINLPTGEEMEFSLLKAKVGADGGLSSLAARWSNYEQALLRPPAFVRDESQCVPSPAREANRRTGMAGPT